MYFLTAAVFTLNVIVLSEGKVVKGLCHVRYKEAEGMCSSGDWTESWGYNSTTEQCVKYWDSPCMNNKNKFATVKDCLETCNRGSGCLKEPKYQWLPIYNTFYFNATAEKCIKRRTTKKSTDNKKNRFRLQKECEDQCMPSTSVYVRSHSVE
uniref:Pancreatic trypsin inhibitor n=1 Tax=Rhipicephalus appendiculatus TaxID=34631 RepID=A0A131YEX4_RHIAP